MEQPLAREVAVLVRDSSWLLDKMLALACASGDVPRSVAHAVGLEDNGQVEVYPMNGELMRMVLGLGAGPLRLPVYTYASAFRHVHRNTAEYLERFQQTMREVVAIRAAKGLLKSVGGTRSFFGTCLHERITVPGADEPSSAVVEGCGVTSDDLQLLKMECYRWWLLLQEDYDKFATSVCPHGVLVSSCQEDPCPRLREAVEHEDLKLCHKALLRAREAAGTAQVRSSHMLGHTAARMAGVEMEMQQFARTALQALYRAVLVRAPARPVAAPGAEALPPLKLINPMGTQQQEKRQADRRERKAHPSAHLKLPGGSCCRPLHSHITARARQLTLQQRLAADFLMLAGGSRSKSFHELERNSTGPAGSLPPLVLLRGRAGSGKTSMLAYFSTKSGRCSAQRGLVRHMTSSKFSSHYSTVRLPFSSYTPLPHATDATSARQRPLALPAASPMPPPPGGWGGLVIVPFFRDSSQSLSEVLDYLSREITMQSTGSLEEEGESAVAGGADKSQGEAGVWADSLMDTSFQQVTGKAESRFVRQSASAVKSGQSIVIICDGLEEQQWLALAQLVLHIHNYLATQLHTLRFKGHEAPSIQCILSATIHPGPFGHPVGDRPMEPGSRAGVEAEGGEKGRPGRCGDIDSRGTQTTGAGMSGMFGPKEARSGVRAEAREVELLELNEDEKIAMAAQVLQQQADLDNDSLLDVAGEDKIDCMTVAKVVAGKQDASLPLFLVAAAAQVN
jgi:hypothetical protein